MPKRLQRSRVKGYRMPEGAVYVGRPTKWGNPIEVGDVCQVSAFGVDGLIYEFGGVPISREIAVAVFREEWESRVTDDSPYTNPQDEEDWRRRVAVVEELRGKDLVCWCPLNEPCHADVLLELANR